MSGIYDDITKTIGNTPLVRLNRVTEGLGATVLVSARAGSFQEAMQLGGVVVVPLLLLVVGQATGLLNFSLGAVLLLGLVLWGIDVLLLALLALTALTIVRLRGLFPLVMLTGIYSFLGAGWMMLLDAPDVAFTEAAVGAGMSTVLVIATLALVGSEAKAPVRRRSVLPVILVVLTGAVLVYGTLDMPPYGSPDNPAHHHVAPRYIEESPHEVGLPNIVNSVLASYRGFDTMGETTVIFTAAVGVLTLLAGRRRRGARVKGEDGAR